MNCTLMHKRLAVATLELDEATGLIQKIHDVLAPAHLPVGVSFRKGAADSSWKSGWFHPTAGFPEEWRRSIAVIITILFPIQLMVRCRFLC